MKSSDIKLPEVHGIRKNLDPNILPEKQHANPIKGSIEKSCICQGRAELTRRSPASINETIIPPWELSQKIPGETKVETRKTNHVNFLGPTHSINNIDEEMTHTIPPSQLSHKIPGETKVETRKTNLVNSLDPTHSVNNVDEEMIHTRPLIPDVPFHPGPTYRPPSKPIKSNMPRRQESSQSSDSSGNTNINSDINFDFEENSPF